uniref:Phage portal protein n=1 Tax=Sphingobacterium sp. (strain 21) TaxID=743722 RepID=F4C2D1_SPHS2
MAEVKFIDDQYALIGEQGDILVDMGEPLDLLPPAKPSATPVEKDQNTSEVIAFWGEDNDFPQKVIEDAELSTEIPALLDWKGRVLQGRRVLPFLEEWDDAKQDFIYKYVPDQDIIDFLNQRTTKRYFQEAANDFVWFWNVFPELIKSESGDKIAQIVCQDASYCRFEKMDKKGKVNYCYINANWPDAKVDDPETIKRKVIDPYQFDAIEVIKADRATTNYIYPVSYPSPGKNYYQLAPWNGYRTSGWQKIAQAVPKSKAEMTAKLLSAKYILSIPINYWPTIYKDWAKLKPEEQREKKKQKVSEINTQLTGAENAGKTILTEVGYDINGKEIPAWKIEPIKGHEVNKEQLEDSREASEHLMRALGVDPTLVGDGPGKKMGGGSGSDKRVAINIYIGLQQPHRDVILEPLNFIAEFNGWKASYPNLVFRTIEIRLETLDKNHQTTSETTS